MNSGWWIFLWATMPTLPQALQTMKTWGFEHKTTAFTWAKTNKKNTSTFFVGMGYWTRGNPELCLLGTRGNPKRLSASVQQLLVTPIGAHSEKPDEAYSRIQKLVGGPYIELFARKEREGWDCFGNEIDGKDIRTAIEEHYFGVENAINAP